MIKNFLLILLGLVGLLSEGTYALGCDEPSAPEVYLKKLHSGCDRSEHDFTMDCVTAIHQFCTKLDYNHLNGEKPRFIIGVQRDVTSITIALSCISARSYWPNLHINKLTQKNAACNSASEAQTFDCLKAAHKWCSAKHKKDSAGIIQGVSSTGVDVGCYKVAKQQVSVSTLKNLEPDCKYTFSAQCYAAISKYCSNKGFSGGVPMTGNNLYSGYSNDNIYVGCYKADFTGDAYLERSYVTASSSYQHTSRRMDQLCYIKYAMARKKQWDVQVEELWKQTYKKDGRFKLNVTRSKVSSSTLLFTHDVNFPSHIEVKVPYTPNKETGTRYLVIGTKSGSGVLLSGRTSGTYYVDSEPVNIRKTVNVKVPKWPWSKAVQVKAVVTRSIVEIPFMARAITVLGTSKSFRGIWKGEGYYNLKVTKHAVR